MQPFSPKFAITQRLRVSNPSLRLGSLIFNYQITKLLNC